MASETNLPFEKSPLWKDVKSTILNAPSPGYFKTEITIHTKDKDFKALKIKELQERNDYVKEICGSGHITMTMGLGDYVYDLYPYRDLLEVTIKRIPAGQNQATDDSAEIQTVRYRAILDLNKGNPSLTGMKISGISQQNLNQNQILDVTLELIDRNIEVLRVATVTGNTYNQVTPKQLISGIMTGESNRITVDGAPVIEGFSIIEPDNKDTIATVLIPPSLKIANVPTFLQEKVKGVYATGIGTHYQRFNGKPSWFVYPLYDLARFDTDVERLVIFAVPEDKMSGLDKTYRKDGRILYVAATGKQVYRDDSQITDLNSGAGFRMPDATGIITKPANISDGKITFDRSRLNTEIATRDRKDGVTFAPVVAPSANPYRMYSQLAAKQMSQMQVVWENSNPDLLYPGMPCKYVFMDKGEYREIRGVLLGRYTSQQLSGPVGTASSYRTGTVMALAMEYYDEGVQS